MRESEIKHRRDRMRDSRSKHKNATKNCEVKHQGNTKQNEKLSDEAHQQQKVKCVGVCKGKWTRRSLLECKGGSKERLRDSKNKHKGKIAKGERQ